MEFFLYEIAARLKKGIFKVSVEQIIPLPQQPFVKKENIYRPAACQKIRLESLMIIDQEKNSLAKLLPNVRAPQK